jgi:hypothetical protein
MTFRALRLYIYTSTERRKTVWCFPDSFRHFFTSPPLFLACFLLTIVDFHFLVETGFIGSGFVRPFLLFFIR